MTYRPRALSVSAVQLYVKCPAQYRQRYVERLVSPINPPLMFGKAFHAALEAEHRGENSERALIQAWNRAEADLAASGQVMHPGKAHALALLDAYKQRGLGGRIGIPERKFTLRFPSDAIPVPLTGYVDLLLPEQRRLREFKTTASQSWTPVKVQLEHQLHVYGWAYQRLFNHRVECAEYVIFRTDQPQITVIEAIPSADGFRVFEAAASAMWRGLEREDFDGCGEKSCATCTPPTDKPSNGPSFDWEE